MFPLAKVIGHRGVPTMAIENTLEGIEVAGNLNYSWIEIDVQTSSDNVAFVHHDSHSKVNPKINLSELPIAKITNLRIYTIAYDLIPSFSKVIELSNKLNLNLLIEIKTIAGREEKDVLATLNEIEKINTKFMIASFSATALELVHQKNPDIPLALNTMRLTKSKPEFVSNIHFDYRHAHPSEIEYLLDNNYGLYAFTINDERTAKRIFSYGVHGIFTDNHEIFQKFK